MLDFTEYKEYLSDRSFHILTLALEETKRRKQSYLGTEHIFLAYI
jgi:hypothetical protein